MQNEYGQLVEQWKVDLIQQRARKKGFRAGEFADVEQVVIRAVMAFRFDPAKSNGATEATALTAVIDRQLAFIRRSEARNQRREKRLQARINAQADAAGLEVADRTPKDAEALSCDVREAVSKLTEDEQFVCEGLARGVSRAEIARELGITRHQMEKIVLGVRNRFREIGLEAWVRGA